MAVAGIHELFYDPSRIAYDEGRWIAPIGGHSDHVHVSFANVPDALTIISYANEHGLRVAENPYVGPAPRPGVHVHDSYHYRTFPGKVNGRTLGMAVDVTGTPAQMAGFASWVRNHFTTGTPPPPTTNAAAAAGAGAGLGCLVPVLGFAAVAAPAAWLLAAVT